MTFCAGAKPEKLIIQNLIFFQQLHLITEDQMKTQAANDSKINLSPAMTPLKNIFLRHPRANISYFLRNLLQRTDMRYKFFNVSPHYNECYYITLVTYCTLCCSVNKQNGVLLSFRLKTD